MAEPVDVTVGMGTPVRVHVTRRPLSKVQALTESLYQAQKDARTETRAHLKRAGETFLREQADQRSVSAAHAKGRGGSGAAAADPQRSDFRARQQHHEGAQLRDSVASRASSSRREPFYPPPNKTHSGAFSSKPQRSLRQVRAGRLGREPGPGPGPGPGGANAHASTGAHPPLSLRDLFLPSRHRTM